MYSFYENNKANLPELKIELNYFIKKFTYTKVSVRFLLFIYDKLNYINIKLFMFFLD